jgi:hypothetical protein
MNIKCNKCGESIEFPLTVRWEEVGSIHRGYHGSKHFATIFERRVSDGVYYDIITSCNKDGQKDTLDDAKAEAQRLFDEWIGGLMNG